MATLYVTEMADLASTRNAQTVPVLMQSPITEQTVAIGAGSTASAAFNTRTRFVELFTDTACGISFGPAPTAVATSARMAANTSRTYGIPQDKLYKVAVITP